MPQQRFQPGDEVFSHSQGKNGMVRRRVGGASYEVAFPGESRLTLPESDLTPASNEHPVLTRLLRSDFDAPEDYDLYTLAQRLDIAHSEDPHASLSNSRLEPQEHQVYVTHKAVTTRLYPRLLMADDVGLGKTIEAGLILKELKARGLVRRVLIVAPASLVTQWEREMRKKFNERFTIFNSEREGLYQSDHPDKNIWQVADQVICSLQFARDGRRAELIAKAGWDLVIFDEAHHVRRSREAGGEKRARKLFQLAELLRDRTKGMLLLTATPLQLQDYEFYSLLELLDPSVFQSYEEFRRFQEGRAEVNRLVGSAQTYHKLPLSEQVQVVEQVSLRLNLEPTEAEALSRKLQTEAGREETAEALSPDNRLTTLMVRNRKAVVGGFVKRQAKVLEVEMTPAEWKVYQEMRHFIRQGYNKSESQGDRTLGFVMEIFQKLLTSSPYALTQALKRRIERLQEEYGGTGDYAPEADEVEDRDEELSDQFERVAGYRASQQGVPADIHALQSLIKMVESVQHDTKLDKLTTMLRSALSDKKQKVLIFTQFRETLEYLRQRLSHDYHVVVFHGGMNPREKDQATEVFRNSAQIMIATEAGSEGRNFQFANILVNYDLPYNPMKIEQRIGRLDRIGQKRDVFVYNFSLVGTVEEKILDVLQKRIRVFEEAVGGLDPILGDVERDLTRLLLLQSPEFDREVEVVAVSYEDLIRRARRSEEQMADFVMDRASFRKEAYNRIHGHKSTYTHQDMELFLQQYFRRRMSVVTKTEDGVLEIEPPALWQTEYQDLYSQVTIVGTCNPSLAIQREELEFFAFGNQVFDIAMGDCLKETFPGRVTSRICRNSSIPDRRLLLGNLLVSYQGVRTYRRLVAICLDLDTAEAYMEEGPALELAAAVSSPDRGPIVPESLIANVQAAWDDMMEQAVEYAQLHQPEFERMNQEVYHRERERLQRYYQYRLLKLVEEIAENQALIERFAREEPRVLPIYRKKDHDLHQQLDYQKRECDRRLAELDNQQKVVYVVQVQSAAFVTTQ